MKKFLAACAACTLVVATAAFADPQAEPPAEEAATTEEATTTEEAAPESCDSLEGDAKTACEEKAKAEAEAEKKDEGESKGGKAQRSNTNRMESEYTDE